jgi:hypothetical protein
MVRQTGLQMTSSAWSKHKHSLHTGALCVFVCACVYEHGQGTSTACTQVRFAYSYHLTPVTHIVPSTAIFFPLPPNSSHTCDSRRAQHCHSLPPAPRLILFLQQSSVEWASSLWLNVVQEVDPTFQRTVSFCVCVCVCVCVKGGGGCVCVPL